MVRIAVDVILGIDVMSKHGFKHDLKEGTLWVGNKELVLNHHNKSSVQIIIKQDEVLPDK